VITILPRLIAACIAFSAAANVVHAQAVKPKPWAKKFTMSREECRQRLVDRRNRIGAGKSGHFSGIKGEHEFGSHTITGGYPPSYVWKCTEKYGWGIP